MRQRFKQLRIALLLGIALIVGGSVYAWDWLHQPISGLADSPTYEVSRGASLASIARDLQQHGWLKYPHVWRAWVRYRHLDGSIKAGEYALPPGLTPNGLLQLLTSGEVILHSITFIEGSTFKDMRDTLARHADLQQTLTNLSDGELMKRLKLGELKPEGQFFPDTYQYPKGTSDLEILSIAQRRMQHELDTIWATRANDLSISTPYEALILASIVEKETALSSERPMIAGVFLERLERGMKLQTDPTVIYGLGSNYDGNLHKDDMLRDSPYNTYTRTGLPPTPICLPGVEALRAAVNPQRTGALYFVATGHGDGSHYFSRNLDEHNAAVQRYLQTLRASSH